MSLDDKKNILLYQFVDSKGKPMAGFTVGSGKECPSLGFPFTVGLRSG